MKWGKRSKASSSDVKEAVTPIKKGPEERAHPDAINAKTQKARAKKSGVNALSNQDLEVMLKRMDLEQRYNKLNPTASAKGRKVLNEAISNSGKKLAKDVVNAGSAKAVEFAMDNYQQFQKLR